MDNDVFYSKEKLADSFGVSERIVGEITSEFVKVIKPFAKKQGIRRQYTYDEARAIEYVLNQKGRTVRSTAVNEALRLIFRIECDR